MGQSLSSGISVLWETATDIALYAYVNYHSTAGVSDSSNSFDVTGNWPNRSGAVGVSVPTGGGAQTIYDASIQIAKVYGSTQGVAIAGSLSGINYWGAGNTISTHTGFTVPARAPSPPSPPTIAVINITATSAGVFCTAAGAENGATTELINYRIHRASDNLHMGDMQAGYAGVTFTNLARATAYDAYAQAKNAAGWGSFTPNYRFTTPPVAPTIGTGHTATALTRNSATITGLSVSDNGGAAPNDVRVQYNTTQSETGATVVTRGSWADVPLPGLSALTTYQYRVAAANSAGWGAYGAWKSFTTLSDAPNDMAAPTFSSVTDTSFRMNWVTPAMNGASFVNYKYDVSLTNTFATLVTTGTTTALFADILGLTPGTKYFVRVRANATPNNGGYGSSEQTTTGIAPNSGMRAYACIDGVIKPGTLYTFVGGVRHQLRPMLGVGTGVQTE